MAADIKRTSEPHLDDAVLAHIVKGDFDRTTHPDLFSHLQDTCTTCDDFLGQEGLHSQDAHELSSVEADLILASILEEIEPDRLQMELRAKRTQSTTGLQSWLEQWSQTIQRASAWMLPVAAMATVLIWFGMPGPTSKVSLKPPRVDAPKSILKQKLYPTTKVAYGKRAFLHIRIERKAQHTGLPKRIPFTHNKTYRVGDAMLFRFQVMQKGYVYLLRQGPDGSLETLFPFSGIPTEVVQGGSTIDLKMNGKRVAYFLEPLHKGKQILWLVHLTQHASFPKHVSNLTTLQKSWLKQADSMHFSVQ